MADELVEVTSNKKAPKAKPIVSIPKDVFAALNKGCSTYTPIKGVPFKPQKGKGFDKETALFLINADIYAYTQFCNPDKPSEFPSAVENGQLLYWHELFNIFNKKMPCGYIAEIKPPSHDKTNRVIIAIRGTEKMEEWVADLDYTQTDVFIPSLKQRVKIHTGFWDTFTKTATHHTLSLQKQIHQYLNKTKPDEIYVIGHSLGASVSTLILFDLILSYPGTKIISYTIGSPRVGDRAFASAMEELAKNPANHFVSWRIVNTEDIVTTVPLPHFREFNYSHLNNPQTAFPNTLGTIDFTENLASVTDNHNPLTYYYAIKKSSPDKQSK